MRRKPTNPELIRTIAVLRKRSREKKAPIWSALADYLTKPRRSRVAVNLSRIFRNTSSGDTVVVPGKVLGSGALGHNVVVAAFGFSSGAEEKIVKAGGKCLRIPELIEANPKGTKVKILR